MCYKNKLRFIFKSAQGLSLGSFFLYLFFYLRFNFNFSSFFFFYFNTKPKYFFNFPIFDFRLNFNNKFLFYQINFLIQRNLFDSQGYLVDFNNFIFSRSPNSFNNFIFSNLKNFLGYSSQALLLSNFSKIWHKYYTAYSFSYSSFFDYKTKFLALNEDIFYFSDYYKTIKIFKEKKLYKLQNKRFNFFFSFFQFI